MREIGGNGMDVRDLHRTIEALSPEKRALLERRLVEMGLLAAGEATIPRRDRAKPCPLSFGQQRLWFLDQWEPQSSVYNIAKAVRLEGELRVEALRRALSTLVARHEVLRTTYRLEGEEPVQVVGAAGVVELPVLDLRGVAAGERAGALERALRAEARRPFALGADLMLRAVLVREAERVHVLLLTMHHIASDGWSMGVLTRELGALYAAHVEGREAGLPELPVQYGDYAVWQREWLRGEELGRQLAYWRGRLAGMAPTLQLPTDRPRPAVQTYRGARETRVLSGGLTEALQAFSRRERATLFMTLLGAFQTVLHRYAGTEDVVVGTAIAGRRRVETEGLIGFFVNTLVLRTDLSGDPAFRELLGRVRETVVEAYDHQDLPFEKLVEELRPERSLSWTPLVQVMFTLEEDGERGLELPGLVASPVAVDLGVTKFDLTAAVRRHPDGLRVTLGYNADLYDAGTIRRMLGHYETLLAGIVSDPTQRLSRLPLLTDAERHQLVVGYNPAPTPFPRAASVAALFEAQVARTPSAVAVTCDQDTLTYRRLNDRANQLAHCLRRHGVGPDVAVGICLEPSLELIVGLLGILKAGGAYVPLDPAYPAARLAFMLEDAQVAALVTRQSLAGRLPAATVPIIACDAGSHSAERTGDPPHSTTGEHLAYLMYTSGSTGQPKAVAVPHRGVTRLVMHTDYVTITPADVVAQASSPSFDAATFEIWGALLNGARLAVIPREVVLSPAAFAAALERHGVTILFLTTALFNQTAREAPSAFRRLRTLLFGGETAEPRWVEAVLAHGAPERLLNAYGPTETTTFACWYPVRSVPAGATSIPIGRPISNTQVYLLDRHVNPVPLGVSGELHVGGPGVARGYHRRPELTAEKFIPDPFTTERGARLYKTGDLARRLPDGAIEFLGRMDQQVKIRGHRIEPGEIETALRQHPSVREVIVLAREDVPGDRRLVAYLVLSPQPGVTSADLRHFLHARLPEYMIPARFVLLDALPLTANGKVDRGKLPAPEAERGRDAVAAEPAGPVERALVSIWEDVLGVRPVSTRDNFFDLGGHSLLAARLVARVRKTLGTELPLAALFQAPTVEQLARMLQHEAIPAPGSLVVSVQPTGSRPPLFCIGCPGDFVRCVGFHLGSDQPCYALAPHGYDGRRAPSTVERMAAEYLAEIRSLQPAGPYFLVGYSFGGLTAFEVAQQLQQQGQAVGLLALIDPTGTKRSRLSPRFGLHTTVSSISARVRRDVDRHWGQLQSLPAAGKLAYLWVRVRARVERQVDERIGRRLKRAVCAFCLRHGRRVPPRLRKFYFVEAGRQAARAYAPRVYPGRAVLFLAQTRPPDARQAWAGLAAGGVEIHEIPTDHFAMLREPHVRFLAERLKASLQAAQAAADGNRP